MWHQNTTQCIYWTTIQHNVYIAPQNNKMYILHHNTTQCILHHNTTQCMLHHNTTQHILHLNTIQCILHHNKTQCILHHNIMQCILQHNTTQCILDHKQSEINEVQHYTNFLLWHCVQFYRLSYQGGQDNFTIKSTEKLNNSNSMKSKHFLIFPSLNVKIKIFIGNNSPALMHLCLIPYDY